MTNRIPEGFWMTIRVEPIQALESNYIWLIHDGQRAVLVDPGCEKVARRALLERSLEMIAILLTHHHNDHIAGVAPLIQDHAVPVYGPHDDRIDRVSHPLRQGDTVQLEPLALNFDVLETPGHTRSHIVYFNDTMIFAGDTLFSMGCGRLFEGTAAQMQSSLDAIAKLNGAALVYCGHEYTQANVAFARSLEPGNAKLMALESQILELRRDNLPTLPVTLAQEKELNPFLRTRTPEVIAAARRADAHCGSTASEVFATLRTLKDRF